MNETLILIAEREIKDQSLTSQEAQEQINKYDYAFMLRWCFVNLHHFTRIASRKFALQKIQTIIDNEIRLQTISINSRDDLIGEFFFKIFEDQDYSDITLLNKISDIQTKIIKWLYPDEWPTPFDLDERVGIMNFPDNIFYNFLKSFCPTAKRNPDMVNLMLDDGFSLTNLLNRISESVIQDSFDAKKSYIKCFTWIDYHILIELPCFYTILDEFIQVPNPENAILLLSTIFKQDKMNDEERIGLIISFKLFDRFSKYLKRFSVIDAESFNSFINLLCNIFEPLNDNEFVASFFEIFTTTFTKLIKMTNQQNDNYRLNDLFYGLISNEMIEFSALKEIYYPMLIDALENPKDYFDINLSLVFDLIFRNVFEKEELIEETDDFLGGLHQTINNLPAEQSKFKYIYFVLNEFYSFFLRRISKIVMRGVLESFFYILDIEPTSEQLSDEYFAKSLKSYSDIFVRASLYHFNSKSYVKIREKTAQLFNQQFKCTFQGCDLFMNSMYSLSKLPDSNITSLHNINDIVIYLISTLNYDLFKIALSLLEKANDEIIGMIKSKSAEMILSRDPSSFTSSELRMIILLFSLNQNQEERNEDEMQSKKEKQIKKEENKFSGFLFISPENQECFDFLSQIYLTNGNSNEEEEQGNEEEDKNSKDVFDSIDTFYEYVIMMVFLFGYRSFPLYSSEIFEVPENQSITVITSIASILSTKFQPVDIENYPITPEVEQTNNFLIEYAQSLLNPLFNIIGHDIRENKDEPSKDLTDLSMFYSSFTRYILCFAPLASQEIFLQILSIFQQLFKYPVLSSEAYKIFFDYIFSLRDASLVEEIYPYSVDILSQLITKPAIFPVDFKSCAIEFLSFHHRVFQEDKEWGISLTAPAVDILNNDKLKFHHYIRLLETDEDQFCTELGKMMNSIFKNNYH